MVDINRLKARMVLAGYDQKTLTSACREKGYKTSYNTINAKFNEKSPITCDDAEMFCDVLDIHEPAERAGIFLAPAVPKVG